MQLGSVQRPLQPARDMLSLLLARSQAWLTVARVLPDPTYVRLLGELAYRVSALEHLVIGDLGNILPRPAGLDAASLLGRTTWQIGDDVGAAAVRNDDEPAVQAFCELAEAALKDVSERRNHVLHARPATTDDGQQMLLRDRFTRHGKRDLFWITPEFLVEQIAAVDDWHRQLEKLRLT